MCIFPFSAATVLAQFEPSLAELLGGRDLVLPFSGISHFRKEVVFVGLAPGQHRHTLDSLAGQWQRFSFSASWHPPTVLFVTLMYRRKIPDYILFRKWSLCCILLEDKLCYWILPQNCTCLNLGSVEETHSKLEHLLSWGWGHLKMGCCLLLWSFTVEVRDWTVHRYYNVFLVGIFGVE